ncbi:MAG TPA: lamin tail domain-containing protein, partial [Flavisolibacter sp.]
MRQRPLLLAFLFLSVTSQAQVVINEVNIAGANEFIELYNKSSCAVDLGCYTLVFSSTSGGGNATGWTVKLPAGKSIAPCGYFLIGGVAGAAGVVGGTGYPNGGSMSSYPSADLDVGTTAITANAVYMKQGLSAGTLPNSEGQITLLSPAGTVVSSVSYNNGNNPGTYPLSAYATCNATGNTQGVNNISNPGASPVNINASFTAAGTQGIYLNASNVYVTTSVLTPKAANPSQLGCTPTITTSSQAATICFSAAAQQTTLSYSSTTNSPTQYSIAWNPTPVNNFAPIVNAGLPASPITIVVPGGTMAGTYTGFLTVANANGHSCTPVPFTFTVNPAPVVDAGSYGPLCTNSSPHILTGIPAGGAFSGTGVGGNIFSPPGSGSYPVQYSFTDATTGCSNTATTTIVVNQQPIVTVTPS